ncbi:hypothetical protein BJF79_00365 [Actinomadura sp. CNU-125]|nr:hypothetical protein BJF79_00365 [Actinomadura sp. CNU-125]
MGTAPIIELDSTRPEAIDGRRLRAVAFQDVRMAYLAEHGPARGRALVLGGGHGVLPRGLARAGLDVTALDPSEAATRMAADIATAQNLAIAHRTARAEEFDAPPGSFDLVYVADTFEITEDPNRVVERAARALKPGGALVYDTVNRTVPAKLVYLGAFQRLPWTRIMPPGRYASARLRRPSEVEALFRRHGLHPEGVCGFKPASVAGLVKTVLARRRGEIGDDGVASMAGVVLDPDGPPVVTYLGHARKRGAPDRDDDGAATGRRAGAGGLSGAPGSFPGRSRTTSARDGPFGDDRNRRAGGRGRVICVGRGPWPGRAPIPRGARRRRSRRGSRSGPRGTRRGSRRAGPSRRGR